MAFGDLSSGSPRIRSNPENDFARSLERETGQKSADGSNPDMSKEAELLARIQAGDESAMAVLYDRYSRIVYSVALRVLRSPASAEDVMQEVFMQIWRHPESFAASRGSMGGWLAVVARNRSIDLLRRRKPTDSVEDVVLPSPYDLAAEAEQHALLEKTRAVMQTLSPEQRKSVEMAFFDGLTHAEIAETTGDPLGTVKTRIRSALIVLRKAMHA